MKTLIPKNTDYLRELILASSDPSRRRFISTGAKGAITVTLLDVFSPVAAFAADDGCGPPASSNPDESCSKTDPDENCGVTPLGSNVSDEDQGCNGNTSGTLDADDSCSKLTGGQLTDTDESCTSSSNLGGPQDDDDNCGNNAQAYSDDDANCGKLQTGGSYDEDDNCNGTKLEKGNATWDADEQCNRNTPATSSNEDEGCGIGSGTANPDEFCGTSGNQNFDPKDEDENCGHIVNGQFDPDNYSS